MVQIQVLIVLDLPIVQYRVDYLWFSVAYSLQGNAVFKAEISDSMLFFYFEKNGRQNDVTASRNQSLNKRIARGQVSNIVRRRSALIQLRILHEYSIMHLMSTSDCVTWMSLYDLMELLFDLRLSLMRKLA